MKILYDQSCSFESVTPSIRAEVQAWLNENKIHSFRNGTSIEFDNACVMNSFHQSLTRDPYKDIPHPTVRLSNTEMRSKFEYATLHWRPDGLSFWLEKIEIYYEEQAKFVSRKESFKVLTMTTTITAPERVKTLQRKTLRLHPGIQDYEEKSATYIQSQKEAKFPSFDENPQEYCYKRPGLLLVSTINEGGWRNDVASLVF